MAVACLINYLQRKPKMLDNVFWCKVLRKQCDIFLMSYFMLTISENDPRVLIDVLV